MNNVKNIKKNLCKLEINLNKLYKECDNDDESNDNNDSIDNIDKYLDKYCLLLNSVNDDNINNKTIEELIQLLKCIELMEKNIKSYQKSNTELDIINL